MVQYVEPFSSVQLADMASAFGTEGSRMLKEVEELVEAGKIAGKIDLIDNVSDFVCIPANDKAILLSRLSVDQASGIGLTLRYCKSEPRTLGVMPMRML